MYICNTANKLSGLNFQGNRYIYSYEKYDCRIKSVIFDRPITLDKAISEISFDKKLVEALSDYKYFVQKILTQIQKDLLFNKELQKQKVKGLVNYGQTAFVFETETGDILKITSRDHFLGRKPEYFDLPVKSQGKLAPKSFCYYYIENKISDLENKMEMEQAVNDIKKSGFKVVDCEMKQFGKTENGRIFLIDPECVRKSGIFGLIKQKFAKIIAYSRIMK